MMLRIAEERIDNIEKAAVASANLSTQILHVLQNNGSLKMPALSYGFTEFIYRECKRIELPKGELPPPVDESLWLWKDCTGRRDIIATWELMAKK